MRGLTAAIVITVVTVLGAQVDTFTRGERVLLVNAPGERAQILALPGDRVQLSGGNIIVNDQPVTDEWVRSFPRTFPPQVTQLTVPNGQYFIASERRTPPPARRALPAAGSVVSHSFGLVPATNIARDSGNNQ